MDFPGIFKLQELPSDMTAHGARASYDEVSEARHDVNDQDGLLEYRR